MRRSLRPASQSARKSRAPAPAADAANATPHSSLAAPSSGCTGCAAGICLSCSSQFLTSLLEGALAVPPCQFRGKLGNNRNFHVQNDDTTVLLTRHLRPAARAWMRRPYTKLDGTRGRFTVKNSNCANPSRGTAVHPWLAANCRKSSGRSALNGARSAGSVSRQRPVSAMVAWMRRASAWRVGSSNAIRNTLHRAVTASQPLNPNSAHTDTPPSPQYVRRNVALPGQNGPVERIFQVTQAAARY